MVADTGLTRVADPESIFLILRVRKRIAIEKNKQRLLISTLLFQLLITKFHTAKSSEQRCIVTNTSKRYFTGKGLHYMRARA